MAGGFEVGSAFINLGARMEDLSRDLDKAKSITEEKSSGMGKIFGSAFSFATGTLLANGLTSFAGNVSTFFGDGIADARAANLVFSQTANVIRSTGGAAGFTAEQVADMAGSLSAASGKSLFGDDDIQRGQNMLLTFTNISDTLPDATKVMLDMAQATGGDMQGAALQLGKSLNNPMEGISALTRVGVTFSEQQKQQIATMQEAGNMAGAQGVIIAELNREFGGSALAAAQADGGMAQFRDRMGELGESIGQQALPLLGQFTALMNNPAVVAGIQAIADTLITGLGTAFTWLTGTAIPGLIAGWNAIQPALATVGTFITGTLIPGFQTFSDFVSANLMPILAGLGAALVTGVGAVIMGVVIPAFTAWAAVAVPAAIATAVAFAPVIATIAAVGLAAAGLYMAWNSNFLGIRDTLTTVWGTVQPVLTTLQTWLATNIPVALQSLSDLWTGTLLPAITSVWSFVQDSVFPLLGSLANVWISLVKIEVTALAGLWQNVLQPALSTVWSFLQDNIMPILKTVGDTISTVLSPIISAIAATFDTWYTAIGGVSGAISTVIGWFDKLATSISEIKLPAWLTPGSPTPLEWGLRGIADAAHWATAELSTMMTVLSGTLAPKVASMLNATDDILDHAKFTGPGAGMSISSPSWGDLISGPGSGMGIGGPDGGATIGRGLVDGINSVQPDWQSAWGGFQDTTTLAMTNIATLIDVTVTSDQKRLRDLVNDLNDAYNRATALNGLNVRGPSGIPRGDGGDDGGGDDHRTFNNLTINTRDWDNARRLGRSQGYSF